MQRYSLYYFQLGFNYAKETWEKQVLLAELQVSAEDNTYVSISLQVVAGDDLGMTALKGDLKSSA